MSRRPAPKPPTDCASRFRRPERPPGRSNVIKARGLDKAANLDIETTELASTEAAKIALVGGSADMVVGDWLWAARERALGDKLLFTPYSTALGAVMAPNDSPVHRGRRPRRPVDRRRRRAARQELAHVAGGGARARASTSPGTPGPHTARRRSSPRSSPQGETDTALEFWNFAADLEARGFRRAIDMADVEKALGATGPVAMTGYVFSEGFAASHKDALKRFFAATNEARKILAEDPSAWAPIKARLRLKDDAALAVYRQRYLEGVPKRTVAEEAADATHPLSPAGASSAGAELVGEAEELDTRLFYDPAAGE